MPELIHNLQDRDLGHLRIIAELWGLDYSASSVRSGVQHLISIMLDAENLEEALNGLPKEATKALSELLYNNGRLAWTFLTRKYGIVREMGMGKRDREKPYTNENASAVEALWYRGLIGRAFFDNPSGPEEFAYIPEDILPFLPLMDTPEASPLGRPASQNEKARKLLVSDVLLDDVCTMLAGLRTGMALTEIESYLRCGKGTPYPLSANALLILLKISGLVNALNQPVLEPVRKLLEAKPGEALLFLFESWIRSIEFNELQQVPGFVLEGGWKNNPIQARQAVIDFIATIPGRNDPASEEEQFPFWSLGALVSAVYETDPDFQRTAGDYDSWYIRKVDEEQFLRGFKHWQEVEGALIKFIIGGPLHWFGVLDLAMPEKEPIISAFRISAWGRSLLKFQLPLIPEIQIAEESVTIRADGRLRIPPGASRVGRYLIARFCEWQGFKDSFYRYKLTPTSLEEAKKQNLRVEHLLTLLNRYAPGIPPSLVTALKRWEAQGNQSRIESLLVLRVNRPDILQALRNTSAQRFLGEALGPTAVVVKQGGWEKVAMTLAELGYLTETKLDYVD